MTPGCSVAPELKLISKLQIEMAYCDDNRFEG